MNRRSFLGAIAALPLAPQALEAIEQLGAPAWARGGPVWTSAYAVTPTGRFSHLTLQKAYRKIQAGMLEAYRFESPEWDLYDDIPAGHFLTLDRPATLRPFRLLEPTASAP